MNYPVVPRFATPALTLLLWLCWMGDRPASADPQTLPNMAIAGRQATFSLLTLPDALLGHWASSDGTMHYYFGQQQVIVLQILQQQDQSPLLHKQKLAYEVSFANEATHFVQLQLTTPLGWAQERWFRLTADRRTLIETMNVIGHSFSRTWVYVDDQQQPLTISPAQVGASIPEARLAGAGAGTAR